MKKLTFPLLFSISLFLFSCSEEINCPEFTEENLELLPYAEGDTIVFMNQNNEIFELIITEVERTEAYTTTCRGRNSICPCYSSAEIKAKNTLDPDEYPFILFETDNVSFSRLFFFNFLKLRFEFDFARDFSYLALMPEMTLYNEFMVDGKTYERVLMYDSFDFPGSTINKVYFNEEYGIIRFTERESGVNWNRLSDQGNNSSR